MDGPKCWRIVNQFVRREEETVPTSFLSNNTTSPFPLCSTIPMRMQSASQNNPIPPQIMKAQAAVLHRVVRKLRAWPAPNDTHVQAKKVRFFTLQPVIALDGIRIGEQWVGGEEGGVQRDHGGCEHRRTAARATVQLRPEVPGKLSRGISGTSECFILAHALLRSSGQLWVSDI